jgi:hypothetical protein
LCRVVEGVDGERPAADVVRLFEESDIHMETSLSCELLQKVRSRRPGWPSAYSELGRVRSVISGVKP